MPIFEPEYPEYDKNFAPAFQKSQGSLDVLEWDAGTCPECGAIVSMGDEVFTFSTGAFWCLACYCKAVNATAAAEEIYPYQGRLAVKRVERGSIAADRDIDTCYIACPACNCRWENCDCED